MKKFDSHKFVTRELNPIFYSLKVKVSRETPFARVRHENYQLLTDDWHTDLKKDLERNFDELTVNSTSLSPDEILDWLERVVSRIEAYGPYYWNDAEEFYVQCLSTSLLDYLPEKEVDELMVKHQQKWTTYIKNMRKETQEMLQEIERLSKKKESLQNQIQNLNEKMDESKEAQKELKEITTRNKVARFVDKITTKLFG
ncbi:MAG: hypothetical protein QXR53_03945 [Candidatus Norongarragalinales archaeon]